MSTDNALHIRGGEIPERFALGDSVLPAASRTPGFRHSEVLIQEGRIRAVEPSIDAATVRVLDARGCLVLPGFIDVHVHGAMGRDTMDADVDGLREMAAFYARHGVTGFLATTMTAPHADTLDAVRAVAEAGPLSARTAAAAYSACILRARSSVLAFPAHRRRRISASRIRPNSPSSRLRDLCA